MLRVIIFSILLKLHKVDYKNYAYIQFLAIYVDFSKNMFHNVNYVNTLFTKY
jgi:hypothetical protein